MNRAHNGGDLFLFLFLLLLARIATEVHVVLKTAVQAQGDALLLRVNQLLLSLRQTSLEVVAVTRKSLAFLVCFSLGVDVLLAARSFFHSSVAFRAAAAENEAST